MLLTAQQNDAIAHDSGNLQLIACAGSGKTEVVAQHITKLLTSANEGGMGLKPANIIAFTFTDKAAAELKQRVADKCHEALPNLTGIAEMYIGTIHGFCLELLRTGPFIDHCFPPRQGRRSKTSKEGNRESEGRRRRCDLWGFESRWRVLSSGRNDYQR
jgi:superfamily I DNA/RNA helicase